MWLWRSWVRIPSLTPLEIYYMLGRSQVGKARDFDSRMRRFESCRPSHFDCIAGVAELADALDLGSSAARRGSSNLFARTNHSKKVKREWLSGRASPCQGECRGFESRLPLHNCGCSSMVEYQPSKLAVWVRFPSPAPRCAHSSAG